MEILLGALASLIVGIILFLYKQRRLKLQDNVKNMREALTKDQALIISAREQLTGVFSNLYYRFVKAENRFIDHILKDTELEKNAKQIFNDIKEAQRKYLDTVEDEVLKENFDAEYELKEFYDSILSLSNHIYFMFPQLLEEFTVNILESPLKNILAALIEVEFNDTKMLLEFMEDFAKQYCEPNSTILCVDPKLIEFYEKFTENLNEIQYKMYEIYEKKR